MYILGDIGNSETKVYLVNSKNIIIKNINFQSKKINNKILNQKFKYLIKDFELVLKDCIFNLILIKTILLKLFRKVYYNF